MADKLFCWLSLVLLAVWATGCTSVSSVSMMGTAECVADEEWEGVWSDGKDQVFHVKVKDAKKGSLGVAVVRWEEGGFKMRSFDAHIRKGEDHEFCNVRYKEVADKDDDVGKEVLDSYFWMLVKAREGLLLVYLPDAVEIGRLIEEGKLSGDKGDGNILLKGSQEDLTELVESSGSRILHWSEPLVLRKVSGL
ncbi:MAG: hypothetical protein JW808_11160 [Victivallales bacterium]|nr:hypothetical protein [Victivallales bacterium]